MKTIRLKAAPTPQGFDTIPGPAMIVKAADEGRAKMAVATEETAEMAAITVETPANRLAGS